MSQELGNVRRSLSRISLDIKQGQLISAATSIRDAARLFGRVGMIKNEADEISSMLMTGCDAIRYNKEITKLFPLAISYVPGQEASLVDVMNQLIETLQESSTEDAIKQAEERKAAGLKKGRQELEVGEHDMARETFTDLTSQFADDSELAVEVGESFMQAGLFEDAAQHLGAAADLTPESAHVFNRLGIALRKMKRFDKAEEKFLKALELEKGDPNLFFNLGRLYLDWQKWEKTLECAEKSLALDPGFGEAGKLASYAKRKIAEGA